MNIKLFTILFLAIIFTFSGNELVAQNAENTKLKHAIGGAAGFTTGYGISYRYWPKKFGVQATFAPYANKQVSRYSSGLAFLYSLIENNNSNLYLYQGNHYYYNSQDEYVFDPANPSGSRQERVTRAYFNNGLGIGVEMIVAKRLGINLMVGYAGYNNFKELSVTGETALYYKF